VIYTFCGRSESQRLETENQRGVQTHRWSKYLVYTFLQDSRNHIHSFQSADMSDNVPHTVCWYHLTQHFYISARFLAVAGLLYVYLFWVLRVHLQSRCRPGGTLLACCPQQYWNRTLWSPWSSAYAEGNLWAPQAGLWTLLVTENKQRQRERIRYRWCWPQKKHCKSLQDIKDLKKRKPWGKSEKEMSDNSLSYCVFIRLDGSNWWVLGVREKRESEWERCNRKMAFNKEMPIIK